MDSIEVGDIINTNNNGNLCVIKIHENFIYGMFYKSKHTYKCSLCYDDIPCFQKLNYQGDWSMTKIKWRWKQYRK